MSKNPHSSPLEEIVKTEKQVTKQNPHSQLKIQKRNELHHYLNENILLHFIPYFIKKAYYKALRRI